MQMRQHLDVHRQHRRAGLDERFGVAIGIGNHQVHVERHLGHPLDRFDDRRPYRDVRHKMAVHHIHMDEISASSFSRLDGGAERREVGRENGRRDANGRPRQRLTSSEIGSPAAI